MKKIILLVASYILVHFFSFHAWADSSGLPSTNNDQQAASEQVSVVAEILASLLELQLNLKEQMLLSQEKLKNSKSEAEKTAFQEEIAQLDRQLSGTKSDFERIATGVESALFAEKKPATFSWKAELASLAGPAIKELKRFTIRVRQKTDLKDKIVELQIAVSGYCRTVSKKEQRSFKIRLLVSNCVCLFSDSLPVPQDLAVCR